MTSFESVVDSVVVHFFDLGMQGLVVCLCVGRLESNSQFRTNFVEGYLCAKNFIWGTFHGLLVQDVIGLDSAVQLLVPLGRVSIDVNFEDLFGLLP